MKNSAAIRSSVFTPALTKALKFRRTAIHCQTAGGHVYITNGFFLVKLTLEEYNEFVRPVAQRDPGSWVIDENGQPMDRTPIDMIRTLSDFASRTDLSAMLPAPFTFPMGTKKPLTAAAFYNATDSFASFFDTRYFTILSPDLVTFRGFAPKSPIIACRDNEPAALLLPLNLESPAMAAAVQAYFTDGKPEEQPKTTAPDPKLTAALEEIARLREELAQTQKQAPATPKQPANKTAAVLSALKSLEGIIATVKGAQTSSPVIWIDGNAEAHKTALEKMGAKWSRKRSAYYIQAA